VRPVLTNATLTSIQGGGSAEDYRAVETDTITRWSGDSPCYAREDTVTVIDQGNLSVQKLTVLLVDGALTVPQLGDNVTFEWLGQTHTRKIAEIVPQLLDYIVVAWEITLER
jgi:hypothetical protein